MLPELRSQLNYTSVLWFVCFMCFEFEIIMLYREYIVTRQDYLKQFNQARFRDVVISYFVICELLLYLMLLGEIVH